MSVRIGQASLGETGAHGQKPGNQTGRELNFAYWYSGSWLGVLRFKDRRKAELAAQACEAGVGNKNIGYDQDGRNTAYVAAEAVDFILSKIAKPVETDCSAFMMLCAISAGVDALKETYRKQGNSCTTYCMMRCFPATGEFELLTDRKYLTSDAYLRRGDILVSPGHTVMVLENGEKEDDDMDKATFTELFREMRKDLQDNDCSDWSEAARQWAVNNGIVQGGAPLPDGSANFMWQDMMTREQLVTMLFRYAAFCGMSAVTLEENLLSFRDVGAVSGYARLAMNWAVGQGILLGSENYLMPREQATRAQVAMVLHRYLTLLG